MKSHVALSNLASATPSATEDQYFPVARKDTVFGRIPAASVRYRLHGIQRERPSQPHNNEEMMKEKFRVSWEYTDGSCGYRDFPDYESACALSFKVDLTARVWIGSEQVQQGIIASDEHGPLDS